MKTKKRSSASSGSRFSRGVKVSAKSSRKHSRKTRPSSRARKSSIKEGFVQKLEDLTPL